MNRSEIDLNQALIFVKIVERQGFTAAAEHLGLPKATVSKKIQDLEARLGTMLLNRTTRRVSMTEAGARFYEHCAVALQEIDAAEIAVRALQAVPQGMLRIGTPLAVGMSYLMPMITDFMQKYPLVQITVLLVNEEIDMVHSNLDVLIHIGSSTRSGHTVRLLHKSQVAMFASPAYLARRGSPGSVGQLADHDLASYTQWTSGGSMSLTLSRKSQPNGEATVLQFVPRLLANDPAAVLIATLNGIGIGVLPVMYAQTKIRSGELVHVLPDWELPPVDVNAFVLNRRGMSLKARVFIDFMIDWSRQVLEPQDVVEIVADPAETPHPITGLPLP